MLEFDDFAFTAEGGLTTGVYTLINSPWVPLSGTLGANTTGLIPLSSFQGTLTTDGYNLFLDVTAIPEPSTWVLVGIALLPLMLRRRRKA